MNFLANVDAIIIDLRENGDGGWTANGDEGERACALV
jgi:C-terminal processing protease CtpA/Prc